MQSEFSKNCYRLLLKIPKGKVTTYKHLAHALRCKGYRAVGQVLGQNPDAPAVPCHRVIRSDGSLGGYALGIVKKRAILQKEGIKIVSGKIDLSRYLFSFK